MLRLSALPQAILAIRNPSYCADQPGIFDHGDAETGKWPATLPPVYMSLTRSSHSLYIAPERFSAPHSGGAQWGTSFSVLLGSEGLRGWGAVPGKRISCLQTSTVFLEASRVALHPRSLG